MKKLMAAGISSALLLSSCAMADSIFGDSNPYLGITYKYQFMRPKGDYADVIPDKFHNYGAYFGLITHNNYGFELGYTQSTKKAAGKTYSTATTNMFGGQTIAAGTKIQTKVKTQSTYFDFTGFWEMSKKWDFLASAGLGWTYAKIQDNGSSPTGGAVPSQFLVVKSRGRMVPRLGLGFLYHMKKWSVRFKFQWENTNKLMLKDASLPSNYYRDSVCGSIGISYHFGK